MDLLATKLILVDGIPGSGKSTTAQWIALELEKRQIKCDWFMDEHRGNPITIWEHSSPEIFITRILDNWKQLKQALESSSQIIVLEGCLFQHFLHGLLAQDVERAKILASLQAVYEIIHPLRPTLIYFYQDDLVRALKTIYTERGTEWAEYMLQGLEQSPYATARHLKGFDALIQYYQECCALTNQLIQDFGLSILATENSRAEWLTYREQIKRFLSLSPVTEEPIRGDYLSRFEGCYRDLSGTHPRDPECTIRMVDSRLVIYNFRYPQSNLIPKALGEFYVETLGYELLFETDQNGQVEKMKVGGKEPGVGIGPITLLGRECYRLGDR